MKFLIIVILSLSTFSAFSQEVAKGVSSVEAYAEHPDAIDVVIEGESAKLLYQKLKVEAIEESWNLVVKAGTNVICSKEIVEGKNNKYQCVYIMKSSGEAWKLSSN